MIKERLCLWTMITICLPCVILFTLQWKIIFASYRNNKCQIILQLLKTSYVSNVLVYIHALRMCNNCMILSHFVSHFWFWWNIRLNLIDNILGKWLVYITKTKRVCSEEQLKSEITGLFLRSVAGGGTQYNWTAVVQE